MPNDSYGPKKNFPSPLNGSHCNIPYCCLQMKPGPCLSPSVIDRPTRPTKHHWLGKLYLTNYLILNLIISNRRTFDYSVFSHYFLP